MKEIFFIQDTVENKVSYYHLAFFLVALPFDYFYSELILISFGLHTLIHVKKEEFRNIFRCLWIFLYSYGSLSLL